jgi:hypothetical protein
MINSLKKGYLLITAMLLLAPLFQACDNDPADPVAKHIKVKAVFRGCDWITLQILNPRYAAWGQEDFNCWDNGNCMSAVSVERLQNLDYWGKLELGKEYYVDIKRVQPQLVIICDIAPGPPTAAATLLKLY